MDNRDKVNQTTALYELESLFPWATFSADYREGWLAMDWPKELEGLGSMSEFIDTWEHLLVNHTLYRCELMNGDRYNCVKMKEGTDVQLATEAAEIRWDLRALDDAVYDKAGALEDTRELINKRFIHRQQGSRNWAYRARQAGYVELVERLAEFI